MRPEMPVKFQRLVLLWKRLAPNRKFLGYAVDEWSAKVNKLDDQLERMKEADYMYSAMIASREASVNDLNQDYLRIASIIWGDEEFGPYSEFTRGLGYKTPDEYASARGMMQIVPSPHVAYLQPSGIPLPSGIMPPTDDVLA